MSLAVSIADSRYHRQQLISWWDQDLLASANVLVVGAGALGNEILKNMALLGVGNLHVLDLDVIEGSNLARCVLFRSEDEGAYKAEVAAAAVMSMNPDVTAVGSVEDVKRLGLGFISAFDLVVAGLDNREARLWINQACRKLGISWVDGAIEGVRGVARVFTPDGPCYECTLSEADRELLTRRRSCSLLSREELLTGKTPTTATTSSVIAGIECQEAVKLLTGNRDLLALQNRGFMFVGETMETFIVEYAEDPDCLAHDFYQDLSSRPYDPMLTPADLLTESTDLGQDVVCELENDVVRSWRCPTCGAAGDDVFVRTVDLPDGWGRCPACDGERQLAAFRVIQAVDREGDVPFAAMGLPASDIVTLRGVGGRRHVMLGGPSG